MSWLCLPLIWATKPTPQASRSWRGSYKPCCIGKEELLTCSPVQTIKHRSLKLKNGDTRRHVNIQKRKGGNSTLSGGDGQPHRTARLVKLHQLFYGKYPAMCVDGTGISHAGNVIVDCACPVMSVSYTHLRAHETG